MNEKDIQACIKEGFRKAFFQDDDLIAMFPGNGDEHDDALIIREAESGLFKAWIVTGPYSMRSPKNITRPSGLGSYSPVYRFKTVREAARLAIENPHY
jgi:hypothetical protein